MADEGGCAVRARLQDGDDRRVAALRALDILDTPEEAAFDEITELASQITGSPVSMISLIDSGRQWFKSRTGIDVRETSLDNSVCAHGIHSDEMLQIEDLSADDRTADMAIVDGRVDSFRFYAGVPLILDDDTRLGMLCVLDRAPRHLDEKQRFAMKVLARQVVTQIQLRRELKRQEGLVATLRETIEERDLIAQEVDHRVKNSLAMVSSFLSMQKRRATSDEVHDELEAASSRVAAISLLHQELYNAAQAGRISLPHFADRLVMLLRQGAPEGVEIRCALDPIVMDSQRAAAFAVITNEFVTNSFKYAFADRSTGCISIGGRGRGEGYEITITDDGVGGATEGRGLGTRIIRSLGQQLGDDAALQSLPGEGVRFTVTTALAMASEEPAASDAAD